MKELIYYGNITLGIPNKFLKVLVQSFAEFYSKELLFYCNYPQWLSNRKKMFENKKLLKDPLLLHYNVATTSPSSFIFLSLFLAPFLLVWEIVPFQPSPQNFGMNSLKTFARLLVFPFFKRHSKTYLYSIPFSELKKDVYHHLILSFFLPVLQSQFSFAK